MKLNYAAQAGLRRRKPDHRRERWAFWGGIAIMLAFEVVLMAKTWPVFHGPNWEDAGAESQPSLLSALNWPWSAASGPRDVESGAAESASALPSQAD